jgi:hypothetical protein
MSPPSANLRNALNAGPAVIILGDGITVAASGGAEVASRVGLLRDGISRCEQLAAVPEGWGDVQRGQLALGDPESWSSVAEQITQRLGGPVGGEFARWLWETVGALEVKGEGRLLDALVALGVPLCTTNYDNLIEQRSGWETTSWRDSERAQRAMLGEIRAVVHLHGHWRDPEFVALDPRFWNSISLDNQVRAMLRTLATVRSIVSVGFGSGIGDPSFAAVIRWITAAWPRKHHRHFHLMSSSELSEATRSVEGVVPVVYGDAHEDLEPFLRGLAGPPRESDSRSRARRPKSRRASETPVDLAAHAAQIEIWMQQGRTHAWIAHQLGSSVEAVYEYTRSHKQKPAFVSYVREDAELVDRIAAHLTQAGVPVWRDVHDLVPGTRWRDEIRRAIASGSAFIAFFSTKSERREKSYMREELVEAIRELRLRSRDRPWFIPVRLDACSLPSIEIGAGEMLSDLQYLDIFDAEDRRAISQLVAALQVSSRE